MHESRGFSNQEPDEQEIRNSYLGFPPEAEFGLVAPRTNGLEFLDGHRHDASPPPDPSEAALDEIRRVGEQLLPPTGSD